MSKSKAASNVRDLRKYYPDMAQADRDYPPLKLKSLKGKYRRGVRRVVGLLEWPAMRRLADRVDPSYKI
jgi:hypothetical protein